MEYEKQTFAVHICSRNGAIPTEVYNMAGGVPSEYFDVGIPDGTGNTYPRFYYDSREGRCIQFSVSFSFTIHFCHIYNPYDFLWIAKKTYRRKIGNNTIQSTK
ncbi:unnamed protein product [Gongylonema pulchrum]|uniref:CUB domain-containing protein n=1 Tax=Gongylonema pulchrum TaxID=637853 RepID=A0A183DK81_9BILA|nr:unnamed protein product [Gongylonema pulchrum]